MLFLALTGTLSENAKAQARQPMPLAAQAAFFASLRRALPILLCPLIESLVVSEGKRLAAENMRNLSARDPDVDPRRLTVERTGCSIAWKVWA